MIFYSTNFMKKIKTSFALIDTFVSCKIQRSTNLADFSTKYELDFQEFRKLIEDSISDKRFFGSVSENILTINSITGRKENLIERSEELIVRCDKLINLD